MVKKLILIYSLTITLCLSANFNDNCLKCHKNMGVSLRKTFMSSLLVYGGKKNFEVGLFYYCKNPISMTSVMGDDYLKRYLPLKKYININDNELKKLLNVYWESYKIIGNLK